MEPARLLDYGELPRAVWDMLARGVADPDHPFHTVALATVSTDVRPSVRMMTLRGTDRDPGCVWFHSDRSAPKIGDLRANPFVSVLAVDGGAGVQVRLACLATLHEQDELAEEQWRLATLAARTAPEPERPGAGAPTRPHLPASFEWALVGTTLQARARFAVIHARVEQIDWFQVYRGAVRSAVLRADDGWAGRPVSP